MTEKILEGREDTAGMVGKEVGGRGPTPEPSPMPPPVVGMSHAVLYVHPGGGRAERLRSTTGQDQRPAPDSSAGAPEAAAVPATPGTTAVHTDAPPQPDAHQQRPAAAQKQKPQSCCIIA